MLSILRTIVQQVNAAGDLNHTFEIIVNQVCDAMASDICSIYLLNDQADHLTLVASKGLNQALMSVTQLSTQQGIVGFIARRSEYVNVDDATQHEAFYLLEGSGEEGARAFLGVPLIHHRKVLGVLVIQRFNTQTYGEDDVSFMITLSAQLSGIIANAEVRELINEIQRRQDQATFKAASAVPGIAIARGWVITAPGVLNKIPDRPCADPDEEISRLREALANARKEIRALAKNLETELPKSQLALFDAYEKLLSYNSLGRKIEKIIKEDSIWAPAALRRVIENDVQQFYQFNDPYLQERATDILDLGRRVLSHLQEQSLRKRTYTRKMILVADHVTSAMIAEVPQHLLQGIISMQGSSTSHAAIIARSMGIPALMGIRDCPLDLLENKQLVLDGFNKELLVAPRRLVVGDYRKRQAREQQLYGKLTKPNYQKVRTKTRDGRRIQLYVNTSPFLEEKVNEDIPVDGVGLYRTEYLFMQNERFPGELEQQKAYESILKSYPGKTVVLRTLDIGGDKSLSYFPIVEENPFLGWRGVRISLDHPEIFITQIRAMLQANIDLGNLNISLPMISTISELERCMALIQQVYDELKVEQKLTKRRFPVPKIGAVIEVPSAVYQIRGIVERVDFVSIGSNDLTQYLFATDRNNTRVSYLYNSLHPAALLAFTEICEAARQKNVPVHICGEIAANPLATMVLIAMGVSGFSMNVRSIPKIRQVISAFSYRDANKILSKALSYDNSYDVLTYLRGVLREHGLLELVDPIESN
jgi:phosphotransferase system enzyme I (PtsP)